MFQALSEDEFEQLHVEAFADESFVSGVTGVLGEQPDRKTWAEAEPFLPGSSYLEVGPGSGHLLAAAHESGRDVTAVESSARASTFIRQAWGLDSVYASFSDLPSAADSTASSP